MAAYCGEDKTTTAISIIVNHNLPISADLVKQYIDKIEQPEEREDVTVVPVNIEDYDALLQYCEVSND
jgi:hypothetical protein